MFWFQFWVLTYVLIAAAGGYVGYRWGRKAEAAYRAMRDG
jgi:hypothetical protein